MFQNAGLCLNVSKLRPMIMCEVYKSMQACVKVSLSAHVYIHVVYASKFEGFAKCPCVHTFSVCKNI